MKVAHWESYYRGGRLAACPTGADPNYTLELREIWEDFFGDLADGSCVLDIGTGNGAIPLIARQTADRRGRRYEIHGADLAQIDPCRDMPDGRRLFADIIFHPGIAAERLPFDAAMFSAVSGQYALEYTDVAQALTQVLRVLTPGARAQFLLHHADSIIVERAQASLRHANLVLMETKVFRKLRRFLDAEKQAAVVAGRAWDDLAKAMSTLAAGGLNDPDRRVIDVVLDAVPKLLGLRPKLSRAALDREIDSVESDLRHSMHRLNDLMAVAVTAQGMTERAQLARQLGFIDVAFQPINHAQHALVGWRLQMRKPL